MTRKTKLAISMSETREKLNALLALDEMTTEQRGEMVKLSTRQQEAEAELRACLLAEPEPVRTEGDSAEQRELTRLIERADLGAMFGAVLDHRQIDGEFGELQKHYGLLGNQVPLRMLEQRAVTQAPVNVGQNQSEIIPGVFPQSCGVWLGVAMPTVGVGESVFATLVTSATAHTPAENAAAAETEGTFSAEVLSPARLQASFFYSREDRARFAGMDSSLRMNLSDALSDGLDKQIVAGTNGLLTGTNLDNNNVSTQTTYALYREQFAFGRVDGTYATTTEELRVLMGSGTYAHAAAQYRGNNDNMDALMSLRTATGGVKVSAHVPDVASTKQNAIVRLGMRQDMVAPIWEGVTLIPDEVTKASNGQIVITAVMLHAVKITRKAGWYKQQTQHA